MNYGHNNPEIKKAIMQYLEDDNIINALDMYTEAKEEFLQTFNELILQPRKLNYKVMCCGPTGTNAVEAALKLADGTLITAGESPLLGPSAALL